jgi:hypothetical protein
MEGIKQSIKRMTNPGREKKKKYQALGERVTSSDKKRKEVSRLELETVEM